MSVTSRAPDVTALEVPMDVWTTPFWEATAEHRLALPSCTSCGTFRWPAGPFCPKCQSQPIEWLPAGDARIFSYTTVSAKGPAGEPQLQIPSLVEFSDAPGVRILAAIVDATAAEVHIGAPVELGWIAAANAQVPVFRLKS